MGTLRYHLIFAVAIAAAAVALAATPTSAEAQDAFASGANEGKYARYVASARVCPGASTTGGSVARQEKAMRCLINVARKRKGLRTVHTDRSLQRSSDYKSRDIIACKDFSHTACGKAFNSTFKRSGYIRRGAWSVGENIAWGTGNLGTPQRILRAWLESSGHRRNIFTASWRDQGVSLRRGTLQGRRGAAVWVNQFGRR